MIALDKRLLRVTAGGQLATAPGRRLYVLETNGALDRTIDPDDVEATETIVQAYSDEAGTTPLSQPLTADADGGFDAWFPAGAYDLYSPDDQSRPIARWTAGSVESFVDDAAFAEGEEAVWDDAQSKLVGVHRPVDLRRGPHVESPSIMFPSGHGWTNNGVGSYADSGAPFIANNDRSYRITTSGVGTESVTTSPALTAADFEDKHVRVQFLASSATELTYLKLRLSSGDISTDYAEATVIPGQIDSSLITGAFEAQTIPLGEFTVVGDVDWSAITKAQFRALDNGAGTSLIYLAGVYGVPTLRKGIVSVTFDDNIDTTYTTAIRRMSRHRIPASAYIITDLVGSANYLTLAQIQELRDIHNWEIGGHAYTAANHNLASGFDSLSDANCDTEMASLVTWLRNNGFPRDTFAAPKGALGASVVKYARRDYLAARGTAVGPETIPPRNPYKLRGFSINGLVHTVADVLAVIDRAAENNSWAILTFHRISPGAAAATTDFASTDFNTVIDYIATLRDAGDIVPMTLADAVKLPAPSL